MVNVRTERGEALLSADVGNQFPGYAFLAVVRHVGGGQPAAASAWDGSSREREATDEAT